MRQKVRFVPVGKTATNVLSNVTKAVYLPWRPCFRGALHGVPDVVEGCYTRIPIPASRRPFALDLAMLEEGLLKCRVGVDISRFPEHGLKIHALHTSIHALVADVHGDVQSVERLLWTRLINPE